jgi:probable addiction module antidote protein
MKKVRATRLATTVPFDAAEFLDDEETKLAYLNEVLAEGDPADIVTALGTIARARGMSQVSRRTGLGRESLYKALGENGNPGFRTILGVAAALGYRFEVRAARARAPRGKSMPLKSKGKSRRNLRHVSSSGSLKSPRSQLVKGRPRAFS